MTLAQRLAREAAPCTRFGSFKDKCNDEATCHNCALRPAIEAAVVKAVGACAKRCTDGMNTPRMHAQNANYARRIRALLTETEETP